MRWALKLFLASLAAAILGVGIWATPFPMRQGLVRSAWAQIGCVPNPNAVVPPSGKIIDGCPVPAVVLNYFGVRVTPVLFGAAGDGVTDDTTAVQGAISACGSSGVPLDFDTAHLYNVTATLNMTVPCWMRGPFRYGAWTSQSSNVGGCTWGITSTSNVTLINVSAPTATITGLCLQMGLFGTSQTGIISSGISATSGTALQFAPPSTTTYQSGITATYNTIYNPYKGITLDGAGYSPGCCGEGSTADGNVVSYNTIINPAFAAISVGKNTAAAETPGQTMRDNNINCENTVSRTSAYGVVLYDGGIDYDGTENGPEGCNIGVAVIPGTVSGVGQNAELNPAKGVMGDQSRTYDLLIEPQTTLGVAGFIEIEAMWAGAINAGEIPVLISNANGGVIQGVKFIGGYIHTQLNPTPVALQIVGSSAGLGGMGEIAIVGTSVDCWGGGSTCSNPLVQISGMGSNQPRNITIVGSYFGVSGQGGFGGTCATSLMLSGVAPAYMSITGNDFSSCTNAISLSGAAQTSRYLFADNAGVDDVCTDVVSSATSITIPNADSCFHVSGSTAITNINTPWSNRRVSILSDAGVSFNTGGSPFPICNSSVTIPSGGGRVDLMWSVGNACWSHSP